MFTNIKYFNIKLNITNCCIVISLQGKHLVSTGLANSGSRAPPPRVWEINHRANNSLSYKIFFMKPPMKPRRKRIYDPGN